VTYPTPAAPGPTALTIITKKTPGSIGGMMKPMAEINGHSVPLEWGTNVIPAPMGVHHVSIYCQYLWRIGKAEITVDNSRAPAPPVYYAVPWSTWTRGAIGFEPVKNPGCGGLLLIFGICLAVVVLCSVGTAILGNHS
jgi:hypothetical protein